MTILIRGHRILYTHYRRRRRRRSRGRSPRVLAGRVQQLPRECGCVCTVCCVGFLIIVVSVTPICGSIRIKFRIEIINLGRYLLELTYINYINMPKILPYFNHTAWVIGAEDGEQCSASADLRGAVPVYYTEAYIEAVLEYVEANEFPSSGSLRDWLRMFKQHFGCIACKRKFAYHASKLLRRRRCRCGI
jgi:hypothetical protein